MLYPPPFFGHLRPSGGQEIPLVERVRRSLKLGGRRSRTRDSSGTKGKNGWHGADPVPTRKVGTGEGMAHETNTWKQYKTCEEYW